MNRPGRPAIGEPVQIRLPAAMLADIDRLAGAVHRYSLAAMPTLACHHSSKLLPFCVLTI